MEPSPINQVLVTPNDSEATSWWLAFSADGAEPFYVFPLVPSEDAPGAVEAVFAGAMEAPLWDSRPKKDGGAGILKAGGAPRGNANPSKTIYKRPEPRPVDRDTPPGCQSHESSMHWGTKVWRMANGQRICNLCRPHRPDVTEEDWHG